MRCRLTKRPQRANNAVTQVSESDRSFAQRLRDVLDEQDVPVRQLAIRLAGEGAQRRQVENRRRQVTKWLSGAGISRRNARRVAAALGLAPDHFLDATTGSGGGVVARLAVVVEELTTEVSALRAERVQTDGRLKRLEAQQARNELLRPAGEGR